ncbi:MAG: spondin domain-containing protein [Cellvibrionaceae bacterium]|nr:spondin domain-containing protein [Cellvibrionaceae bacterium]
MNILTRTNIASFTLPLLLAACGGGNSYNSNREPLPTEPPDEPQPTLVSFSVEVANVTANQPLAPLALVLHNGDYNAWQIGEPASTGLEMLAESGDPTAFIDEAQSAYSTMTGSGILVPGAKASYEISAMLDSESLSRDDLSLTLASMPVNTNDAFTGSSGLPLSLLAAGESLQRLLPIYDAGTEANTETAATVPGPAAGGTGFSEERDDIADRVTRHPGVVTAADGYGESALDSSHRFDQGAILVTITRN